jgi:hypothetical protein
MKRDLIHLPTAETFTSDGSTPNGTSCSMSRSGPSHHASHHASRHHASHHASRHRASHHHASHRLSSRRHRDRHPSDRLARLLKQLPTRLQKGQLLRQQLSFLS